MVVGEFISDHVLVSFNMPIARKSLEHIIKTVRSWKRFNECALSEDLRHSTIANPSAMHDGMELDELVNMYDTTLTTLLDKHCPKRTMKIRNILTSPWLTVTAAQNDVVFECSRKGTKSQRMTTTEKSGSVLSVPRTGCLNLGQCSACHAQAV